MKIMKGVQRVLTTLGYVLSHNWFIRLDRVYVTFFGLLKIKLTRSRRHAWFGYLFIFPWLIGASIFAIYPLFYSLYLSFQTAYYNSSGITMVFVGLNNYLSISRSSILLPLFFNYLGKMVLAVPIIIVFSIIIAVLVNNPIRLKGFWRSIFFLPVIITSGPVINELSNQDAITLSNLQDSDWFSILSQALPTWIADPLELVLNSLLFILWYAGIPILIFLAGLQKVDPALYEAASIDGASPWQKFWKITLPSIMPLTSVSVIYIIVSMSLFVEPGGLLENIRTHLLFGAPDSAFWFGYGYASAIAWIYFILMVILIGIFVFIFSPKNPQKVGKFR
jgi:ABC-type sugar transport system permease subunit